jgi:hypothetical protein
MTAARSGRVAVALVLFTTLGLAAASASAAPPPPKAATYFVSPTGKNPKACRVNNIKTPFKTLSFALSCATGIDTVQAADGGYMENLTLTNNVTLIGAPPGALIMQASGGQHGIVVQPGAQPTIRNVDVENAVGDGIVVNGGGTFYNVRSSNSSSGSGFVIDTADAPALSLVYADGNAQDGIHIIRTSATSAVNVVTAQITNSSGVGFDVSDTPAGSTANTTLNASVLTGNRVAGVSLQRNIPGSAVSAGIFANDISTSDIGMQVLTDADLRDNNVFNNRQQLWASGSGVSVTLINGEIACYHEQFGSLVDGATLTTANVGWVYGGTGGAGPPPVDVMTVNGGSVTFTNPRLTTHGCF